MTVTLYWLGRYGNGASMEEVARVTGCCEGTVQNYTRHCFIPIKSLHEIFIQKLTAEEKEHEKQWIDSYLGFRGPWGDGWLMYDGTIVVLYWRPRLNGDAYFTCKANCPGTIAPTLFIPF